MGGRELQKVLSRLLFVVFDAGETKEIIENQYLSQSPLEIFSTFFQTLMFHKSLIFSSSAFAVFGQSTERRKRTKKLPFLFFAFHFDYESMEMEFHFS